MATFTGTEGGDIYTGGGNATYASGNGGNDTLSGSGGPDTLIGGTGRDSLSGLEGDDQLFSAAIFPNFAYPFFNGISYDTGIEVDTLNGGSGNDYIFAGYGDQVDGGTHGSEGDTLFISFMGSPTGVTADFRPLQSGNAVTIGGGVITGVEHVAYLEGSNFDDLLVPIDATYARGTNVYGRGGNDRIIADYYSGWANSAIWGGDGNDDIDTSLAQYGPNVYGEAGDDIIRMRPGLGAIAFGGDGNDTVYAGGEVHGGAGDDRIEMQITYYTGRVHGDEGNDTIIAVASGNYDSGNEMAGGSGADTLIGGSRSDVLISSDFVDNYGDARASRDMGLERDSISAGGGDDFVAIGYGDHADGGSGTDTLSLSLGGATSGVTIDLTGITGAQPFTLGGGTIRNFEKLERLIGSSFADVVTVGTQTQLVIVDGGAGNDTLTSAGSSVEFNGGAGDDLFISGAAGDTFRGGDGFDTVDYSRHANAVTVSLATSTGPGGDVLVQVEQVIGTAMADTISGGAANEVLIGGDGNDSLDGGAGADRMDGGNGDDSYVVDNSGDVVIDAGGNDSVTARGSWTLGAGQAIELITAAASFAVNLSGNELANRIVGNERDNALSGLAGSDTLTGGDGNDTLDGGAGADHMTGGAGNDVYHVDDPGDVIVEQADGGIDTIVTTLAITLTDMFENLTLLDGAQTNALTGNALDNVLTGNSQSNLLRGGAGNDTLNGGAGADEMRGEAGDDVYIVDHAGDTAIESAGGGNDHVIASVSWTLGASQDIELVSAATGAAVDLSGNAAGNRLVGSSASNMLLGLEGDDTLEGAGGDDRLDGGTGADRLEGGDGHDALFGGDGADSLNGGNGNDHLYGRSTSGGSDGADTIDGAAGSDYIQGNAGNDILNGADGSDRIQGGQGDDRLVGGAGNDSVNGNLGNDAIDGGADNDSLRGGQGNDSLVGGSGNDMLFGDLGSDHLDGGAGIDQLTGGADADFFFFVIGEARFSLSGPLTNLTDAITDFTNGVDRIHIGFGVPSAIARDTTAYASLTDGAARAQTMLDANSSSSDIAVLRVGGDVFLFYDPDSSHTLEAIRLTGLSDPFAIDATDFI